MKRNTSLKWRFRIQGGRMADREGQQLGNYRLLRLLGRGGCADVYLGEHIYLDTLAAIKVLRTQLADEDLEHFRTEARTIARLVHPHIVRVLEFGIEGMTPYLVMDYAPDGTLRKRHAKGVPLPLSTVVGYVTQAAAALQCAHDQRVIHRDVKPENMLLGRHNEVLLSDFGIALVTSSRYLSTQGLQDLAGTIAYMAPEQIQSHATVSSDQYALGIVVYEWLSGTRPFEGTFTEVAVKHALVAPLPLREKMPAISVAVEEVIMRTLAKEPQQRFASVQAFASALEQAYLQEPGSPVALTDTPASPELPALSADTFSSANQEALPAVSSSVQMLPPPTHIPVSLASEASLVETPALEQPVATPPLQQLPKRGVSRRTVTLGLAGVVVTGVLAGGVVWLAHVHEPQGTITPPTSPIGVSTSLFTYRGHSDWVWSVAWSPSGKRVASASSDKTVQVWDAANGDHSYTYSGHADSVYALAWSPDGKHIASASNDMTVQVWDATGGHPFTYTGHSSWVWTVAWSPDSTRIASAGGDKTVQIWNASSGSHLYTYSDHSGAVFAVAWSPDGRTIASAGADQTVRVWDAATGVTLYTYQLLSSTLIWSLAWSPNGKRIASASEDNTVQVWDAADGDHPFTYHGHADPVHTVAWSPDDKSIASAGADQTVQVWDATTGATLYSYSGHSNDVRGLAWAPDGKRIVSGSWDKTVQVWQVR
ncbi:MAG: protein kinase [Ktedonobacteraceae bacterium]|nr:protein kinase [Ktedonobacteraceae bacterium]